MNAAESSIAARCINKQLTWPSTNGCVSEASCRNRPATITDTHLTLMSIPCQTEWSSWWAMSIDWSTMWPLHSSPHSFPLNIRDSVSATQRFFADGDCAFCPHRISMWRSYRGLADTQCVCGGAETAMSLLECFGLYWFYHWQALFIDGNFTRGFLGTDNALRVDGNLGGWAYTFPGSVSTVSVLGFSWSRSIECSPRTSMSLSSTCDDTEIKVQRRTAFYLFV